ncbi:terminase [Puerhibacterium puerhi]|uniref:terminase n=1 Tax=Puerhibacterium puerhi TaxID=2692623 RepID=UPI00135B82EA|nr:terminase [Puerhibacterium puerhi]
MGRQLITGPDLDRSRSLGWLALWFIETFVVHGPGDVEGEPIRHGDEYSGFIVDCYALDRTGRRLHDSAFFSRPKGANKSGLAGELAIFEAVGPCRFEGWAEGGETFEFLGETYTYEPGEPMGRPNKYPFVRIMATEEGQTGNVYDLVHRNFDQGPLSALKAYGLDAGQTRILLHNGGEIRPSTGGSASKDGGKETFAVFDETHLYESRELHAMYRTVTRNLPKRGRSAEPWYLETTTMYEPNADSIAEQTYRYAQAIAEGRARRSRMLFDHRFSPLGEEELGDEDKLRAAVIEAYGEAMDWNSLESIIDKIFDPRHSPRESIRYYLNAKTSSRNAWVTDAQLAPVTVHQDVYDRAVAAGREAEAWRDVVEPGERITLGFDGAVTNDATALVGCRVSDGLLFPLLVAECPDGPEAKDWSVDEESFDAAVAQAFEQFDVVAFFADPPYWQDWIERWEREYGERLRLKQSGKSAIKFWTKNDAPMIAALERLHTAIQAKTAQIFGDRTLLRHFTNAHEWRRRAGTLIGKATKNSPRKIDAAMAATLAFEGRARFLAMGDEQPKTASFIPARIR